MKVQMLPFIYLQVLSLLGWNITTLLESLLKGYILVQSEIASSDTSKSLYLCMCLFHSAIRASKRALPTLSSRLICATSSTSRRKDGRRDTSCASRCLEAKLWCWLFRVKSRPSGGSRYVSEGKTRGTWLRGEQQHKVCLFVCLEVNVFLFWIQVVQDVGSQCSNTEGLDGSTSPIIQRKLELDKVCV